MASSTSITLNLNAARVAARNSQLRDFASLASSPKAADRENAFHALVELHRDELEDHSKALREEIQAAAERCQSRVAAAEAFRETRRAEQERAIAESTRPVLVALWKKYAAGNRREVATSVASTIVALAERVRVEVGADLSSDFVAACAGDALGSLELLGDARWIDAANSSPRVRVAYAVANMLKGVHAASAEKLVGELEEAVADFCSRALYPNKLRADAFAQHVTARAIGVALEATTRAASKS